MMSQVIFVEYPDHFQIRQNTKTLVIEHELIHFQLPFTEKLKIIRSISEHVYAVLRNFLRKYMFLEIIKSVNLLNHRMLI